MKVSLMALVAMFAFNTVADAQLGGLLKKAKAAVTGTSSKDAYFKQQEQLEKARKEQEARFAKEKANKGTCVVKNWKTGEMMETEKLYASMEVFTAEQILDWEQNFRDKEGKKVLIQYIMDEEKFENKKRKAENINKDRKLVQVIFRKDDWRLYHDNWGNITSRSMWVAEIYELTNGTTLVNSIEYDQKCIGSGKYSDTFSWIQGTGKYGLVKDWEHKENADPLADL